jgi:terminase small subunit-like protein
MMTRVLASPKRRMPFSSPKRRPSKLPGLIGTNAPRKRNAKGESLVSICRGEGKPRVWAVHSWLRTKPEFKKRYLEAKEVGVHVLVDQILEIAETPQLPQQAGRRQAGMRLQALAEIRLERVQQSRPGRPRAIDRRAQAQGDVLAHRLAVERSPPLKAAL